MTRVWNASLTVSLFASGVLCVVAVLELKDQPNNIKLKVGQNASLPCRSTPIHSAQCQWMRDGKPVFIGLGKWKSKYDWLGNTKNGDCSLRLIGTDLEHHPGTWQCTVADTDMLGDIVTSRLIEVVLLMEPRELQIEVIGSGMWLGSLPIDDGTVTVQEGTNITANCSICCGSPNSTIAWRKGMGPRTISLSAISRNTQQKNFTWLSEALAELYVRRSDNRAVLNCSAYHDTFRVRRTKQITLNVLYPPRTVPTIQNITGYLNDKVILECPLPGNPEPTFRWYFQGDPNSSWVQVQEEFGTKQTLTLDNANASHAGLYNCTGSSVIFSRNYEGSALLSLSLMEGGASHGHKHSPSLHDPVRALKSTEAIVLGAVLGIILLGGLIGFILWLKKRKTV